MYERGIIDSQNKRIIALCSAKYKSLLTTCWILIIGPYYAISLSQTWQARICCRYTGAEGRPYSVCLKINLNYHADSKACTKAHKVTVWR